MPKKEKFPTAKDKYKISVEGFKACFLENVRGKDCPYDSGWKERYWLWGWLAGEKVIMAEADLERREKINKEATESQIEHPYGYCPECYAAGKTRERCPDGFDTCENGHKYRSAKSLTFQNLKQK